MYKELMTRLFNRECWQADFSLNCFLPWLKDSIVNNQRGNSFKFLRARFCWLADRSPHSTQRTIDQLQKTYLYVQSRCDCALHQNFRLHHPRIGPLLGVAVSARIEDTEIPALLALYGRRTGGVEHVSFIQNGLRNLIDDSQTHRTTASCARSSSSMACSQVGMP